MPMPQPKDHLVVIGDPKTDDRFALEVYVYGVARHLPIFSLKRAA
jgi:hypothetical protein